MDEELIYIVEQHPQIYDLSHKDYDNPVVKDRIWKEIGEKLHKTGEECRNKWTLLRSYFVRARCRRKRKTSQAAKKLKKWRLEDQMQFLVPFLQSRDTQNNVENPPETHESNETKFDPSENLIPYDQFSSNPIAFTPSPAPSVNSASSRSSRKSGRRVSDSSMASTSKLETALTEFINLRSAPSTSRPVPEKKKKLMNFFEDIADTMTTFSDIDVAIIKNKIFTIVNEKEIEILNKRENESQQSSKNNFAFTKVEQGF